MWQMSIRRQDLHDGFPYLPVKLGYGQLLGPALVYCMADDLKVSLASEADQSQADRNGAFGAGRNCDHRVRRNK